MAISHLYRMTRKSYNSLKGLKGLVNLVGEEGGFRKGRVCVDQIFTSRRVSEKVLEKKKIKKAPFMSL